MSDDLAALTRTSLNGIPVYAVTGEIDLSNAQWLHDSVASHPDDGGPLVLDLTEVGYMDSVGIATLDRINTRLPDLRIVAPDETRIGRLLQMVALPVRRFDDREGAAHPGSSE